MCVASRRRRVLTQTSRRSMRDRESISSDRSHHYVRSSSRTQRYTAPTTSVLCRYDPVEFVANNCLIKKIVLTHALNEYLEKLTPAGGGYSICLCAPSTVSVIRLMMTIFLFCDVLVALISQFLQWKSDLCFLLRWLNYSKSICIFTNIILS